MDIATDFVIFPHNHFFVRLVLEAGRTRPETNHPYIRYIFLPYQQSSD